MNPVVHPLGDSGITISLADLPGRDTTERVRRSAGAIRGANIPHVEEVVAAYTAVTVFYDALHASFEPLTREILACLERDGTLEGHGVNSRRHSIQVTYDGPDLGSVASATGLTPDEVIAIHTSQAYTVDLLGFVPGFAYLSELDARLELPRKAQPRQRVPAGSVAIAARLTGVYPFDTPGGWHIIGRTAAVMFDPRRDDPSLLKPGDSVQFEQLP